MNKWERHDLKCDIRTSKFDNFMYLKDFGILCLKTLCKSILTFGISSVATKETIKAFQEFRKILNAENNLYYYLYKHSKKTHIESVDIYLQELFELGGDTIDYYYEFVDNIQVACDLNQKHRIIRDKKSFKTLIESNEFFAKLLEILIDEDELLKFLNISKEFMNYINEENLRTIYVDYNDELEREFIGVNYKIDENGCLQDIKLFVPEIINLPSAMLYLHTCFSAFELYKKLNQEITDEEVQDIAKKASERMKSYELTYRKKESELLPYK